MPKAFGRFRNNLTLTETVCDDCNKFFGRTIDLYLARDTPDGFNRFRLGYRPLDEYKSLGRASAMTHTVAAGPLTGAFGEQTTCEGELAMKLLPQVGFGVSPMGPFKWFLTSNLPKKDQLRAISDGSPAHRVRRDP